MHISGQTAAGLVWSQNSNAPLELKIIDAKKQIVLQDGDTTLLSMTADRGLTSLAGDLVVGGDAMSRQMSIVSLNNSASVVVESLVDSATISLESPIASRLVLEVANKSFVLQANASGLTLGNGSDDMLSIDSSSRHIQIHQDLNVSSVGPQKVLLKSEQHGARVVVSSAVGVAEGRIISPANVPSSLSLTSGSQQFKFVSLPATSATSRMLTIKSDYLAENLLSVSAESGRTVAFGNVTVGGTAAREGVVVNSTNDTATVSVSTYGSDDISDAELVISSVHTETTSLKLSVAKHSFEIVNSALKGNLAVTNGSHDLLTVDYSTGLLTAHGQVMVEGELPRSLEVRSSSSTAKVEIVSGGSGPSVLELRTANSSTSHLMLQSQDTKFDLANSAQSMLSIHSATSSDLFSVHHGTGNVFTSGNLLIGGNGSVVSLVKSIDSTASAILQGNLTASAFVKSHASEKATLSLSSGSTLFSLTTDGSKLQLVGSSQTLLSIQQSTGSTSIIGNLALGVHTSPQKLVLRSLGESATFSVESGGTGAAEVIASGPEAALLVLQVNSKSFELKNYRGSLTLSGNSLENQTEVLMQFERDVGSMHVHGDVMQGNGSYPIETVVASTDSAAHVIVEAASGMHKAQILVQSASTADSKLTLAQGSCLFSLTNSLNHNGLVISNGSNTSSLLHITAGTGLVHITGNLSLGHQQVGSTSMTVKSTQSPALVHVKSSNQAASLEVGSASASQGSLLLVAGAKHFDISHSASALTVADGHNSLIQISKEIGLRIRGNLTVQARNTSSQMLVNSSLMAIKSISNGAGSLHISAGANSIPELVFGAGSASLSLKNDGSFKLLQAGSTALKISTTASDSEVSTAGSVIVESKYDQNAAHSGDARVLLQAGGGDSAIVVLGSQSSSMNFEMSNTNMFTLRDDLQQTLISFDGYSNQVAATGSLAILREAAAAVVNISTTDASASFKVRGRLEAKLSLKSSVGKTSSATLVSGSDQFKLSYVNGSGYISDAHSTLWAIESGTGTVQTRGNLLVGGGSRPAALQVISVGHASQASMRLAAHSGASVKVSSPTRSSLYFNSLAADNQMRSFVLETGSAPVLELTNGSTALLALKHARGDLQMIGKLSVGNTGEGSLKVRSRSAGSILKIQSGGMSNSTLKVSGANRSVLLLTTGSASLFQLATSMEAAALSISDLSNELFTMTRESTKTFGNLVVGAQKSNLPTQLAVQTLSGPASILTKSSNGTAVLSLHAGGAHNAKFHVAANKSTSVHLGGGEQGFRIDHTGNRTCISGAQGEQFVTFAQASAHTQFSKDLLITGEGPKEFVVESLDNTASFSILAGGVGTAQASISSETQSSLVLGTGNNGFALVHRNKTLALLSTSATNPKTFMLLTQTNKTVQFLGDLNITQGLLTVNSSMASATVAVVAEQSAIVEISAPVGDSASFQLVQGSELTRFKFSSSQMSTGQVLQLADNTHTLLSTSASQGTYCVEG